MADRSFEQIIACLSAGVVSGICLPTVAMVFPCCGCFFFYDQFVGGFYTLGVIFGLFGWSIMEAVLLIVLTLPTMLVLRSRFGGLCLSLVVGLVVPAVAINHSLGQATGSSLSLVPFWYHLIVYAAYMVALCVASPPEDSPNTRDLRRDSA